MGISLYFNKNNTNNNLIVVIIIVIIIIIITIVVIWTRSIISTCTFLLFTRNIVRIHGCPIKSIILTFSQVDSDTQCLGFPVSSFGTVDNGYYDTNNDDTKTNKMGDIIVACGYTRPLFTVEFRMYVSTCVTMWCLDSFPTTTTDTSIHHYIEGNNNVTGTDQFSSCLLYCTILF